MYMKLIWQIKFFFYCYYLFTVQKTFKLTSVLKELKLQNKKNKMNLRLQNNDQRTQKKLPLKLKVLQNEKTFK